MQLLVVDDEPAIRRLAIEAGEAVGLTCRGVDSGSSFQAAYLEDQPDIIILDLSLPGTDGVELLRFLADQQSPSQILIVSGHQERVLASAERLGSMRGLKVAGSIAKPIRLATLLNELQALSNRVAAAQS